MSTSKKRPEHGWITVAPEVITLWVVGSVLMVLAFAAMTAVVSGAFLLTAAALLAAPPVRRRLNMTGCCERHDKLTAAYQARKRTLNAAEPGFPCPPCNGTGERHGGAVCITCGGTSRIVRHPHSPLLVDALPARSARLDWGVVADQEFSIYERTFPHPDATCQCSMHSTSSSGRCLVHPEDPRWADPGFAAEMKLPPLPEQIDTDEIADEWKPGAGLVTSTPDGTARHPLQRDTGWPGADVQQVLTTMATGATFATSDGWRDHYVRRNGKVRWTCCGEEFWSWTALHAHLRRQDEPVQRWPGQKPVRVIVSELDPGESTVFTSELGSPRRHVVTRQRRGMVSGQPADEWSCCGGAFYNAASVEYHLGTDAARPKASQASQASELAGGPGKPAWKTGAELLTGMETGDVRWVYEAGGGFTHKVERLSPATWLCHSCDHEEDGIGMTVAHLLYGHRLAEQLAAQEQQIARAQGVPPPALSVARWLTWLTCPAPSPRALSE